MLMEDNLSIYTDSSGAIFHYKNGEYHREDGPAIEYPDGTQIWCYDGNILAGITNQKQFERWRKFKVFM